MPPQIDEYGTIPASALKQIKAGGDGVGLRTYDPCALAPHSDMCMGLL